MKKVLIATDSFKESLSSLEVADSIKVGLGDNFEYQVVPLADGGEGTMELITDIIGGNIIQVESVDPLGRKIISRYGLSEDNATAIIDVASSSGIELLSESEKNPYKTSSYGTGLLIADALDKGVSNIILGLGSSATVDLGFGMLEAIGAKFLNENNEPITIKGESLRQVCDIDLGNINPNIYTTNFKIACDVDNPLTGVNGSCHVFAKQKGATPEQIEQLESDFIRIGKLINKKFRINLDEIPGSGAAGGIGGIAYAFLKGELTSGSDLINNLNRVEEKVKEADIVITGEGKFDSQSLHGKGPMSIINLGLKYDKRIIVICGSTENDIYTNSQVKDVSIFPTISKVDSLENTLNNASKNITHVCTALSHLLR
ncbi:glycerate kinase [Mollicutes bacterium LVI A0078]|nr:glycerate kinase [Mollicutes bacterium LVI A0075]WOO91396.1 glycerate kinase [Mollicutes bacterium LVI A0078]